MIESVLSAAAAAVILGCDVAAQFGGSGADGVFQPTSDLTLDTSGRPDGFSFTSMVVPAGVTVRLVGDHPAVLRCTGAVRIDGTLDASGFPPAGPTPGAGGPGGYAGGPPGGQGDGPAGGNPGWIGSVFIFHAGNGGHATPGVGINGSTGTYGAHWPFDLRGGSGGGGYTAAHQPLGGAGGGGVVVLLADGSIHVAGTVRADGANSGLEGGLGAGGGVLIRSGTDVRVAGTVRAKGAAPVPGFPFAGGDGFVRIDAWADPVAIAPAAVIEPTPFRLALPAILSGPARIGTSWVFAGSGLPNDDLVFLMSTGTASIPLPPLGTLQLDPAQGIHVLAAARVPDAGVDAVLLAAVAIPPWPPLVGVPLHLQALATHTTSAEGPQLSNLSSATIR